MLAHLCISTTEQFQQTNHPSRSQHFTSGHVPLHEWWFAIFHFLSKKSPWLQLMYYTLKYKGIIKHTQDFKILLTNFCKECQCRDIQKYLSLRYTSKSKVNLYIPNALKIHMRPNKGTRSCNNQMFIQTRVKTKAQNKYTKYLVLTGPFSSDVFTLFCRMDPTLGVAVPGVFKLIGRSVGFLTSVDFWVWSTTKRKNRIEHLLSMHRHIDFFVNANKTKLWDMWKFYRYM